jgi:hypothetical protein
MVSWAIVVFCALLFLGMRLYVFALFTANMPASGGNALDLVLTLHLLAIPACALVVLWAHAKPSTWTRGATAAMSASLVILAISFWDDRAQWQVETDRFARDPELTRIIGGHDGDVLWIGGGFATWSLAGRPNWVSRLQGASAIFSRPLAESWDKRARLLTDLGVVDQRLRSPFGMVRQMSNEEPSLRNLDDARLQKLCASANAPAWLIAPAAVVRGGGLSAARWAPRYWTAPATKPSFVWNGETVTWTGIKDYAVIPCAS